MSDAQQRPRRKANKNTYMTKSGKTIKLNRSLGDRMRAAREARAQRKAAYLSSLPKEPWKRWLYRLHPKRVYQYWFSRDGAIMALKIVGISVVVMFLLIVGLFAYFRKDLPRINDINSADSGGSIAYYDRTGKTLLFQDYDAFKRIPVQSTDISQYMKEATIALEDKDFYHEGAFNVKGITRAAINNATGGSTQGGSTITQQLVKLNEGWTEDRTVSRKIKELILAVELEREYSKDDILTGYLNMAPYNGLDYGVEAAAQDYFGVHAKDLTLEQAAMLAAIPKSPGSLSPYASPLYNPYATADYFDKEGLLSRQRYALDLMVKQGYITKAEADAAKAKDILAQVHQRPTSHYDGIKYPYFVLAAKDELSKAFPESVIKTGGWKVRTTLDVGLQDLAEKSLNDHRNLLAKQKADNAAFVAEDNETGEVVALIGGVDFYNKEYGENNFATEINISPGSTIKPYDYATFINNNSNVGAGSVMIDAIGPLPVNGYQCTDKSAPSSDIRRASTGNCLFDYDHRSPGPMTLRYALGGSRNIPAIKAMISSAPGDTSKNRINSVNQVISTASNLMNKPDMQPCYGQTEVSTGKDPQLCYEGYRCYRTDLEDFFSATPKDQVQCYASSGIGDGAYLHLNDHVNGIASLARMGKTMSQSFIIEVKDNSGRKLPMPEKSKPRQVIKPDSAYIVNDMAADPAASYLPGNCNATNCSGMKFHRYKGWTNSIKTGTTNYNFDGLMMVWNPKYTAGIWVGNHTRTIPFQNGPENMTDPIMKQFMQGAIDQLGDVKPQTWIAPNGIKTASAYVNTYKTFVAQTIPSRNTDIYPSWYVGKSSSNTSAATDKVSGKLATSCTPTLARQNDSSGGSGNISTWNVDIFNGGTANAGSGNNNTSQPSDDVHICSDDPPSVSITAVDGVSTSSHSKLTCPTSGCMIMVHVEKGTHDFTDSNYPNFPGALTLIVNGQTVQTVAITSPHDYQVLYKPASGIDGTTQLQVQVTDSVLYSDTDSVTLDIQ